LFQIAERPQRGFAGLHFIRQRHHRRRFPTAPAAPLEFWLRGAPFLPALSTVWRTSSLPLFAASLRRPGAALIAGRRRSAPFSLCSFGCWCSALSRRSSRLSAA